MVLFFSINFRGFFYFLFLLLIPVQTRYTPATGQILSVRPVPTPPLAPWPPVGPTSEIIGLRAPPNDVLITAIPSRHFRE